MRAILAQSVIISMGEQPMLKDHLAPLIDKIFDKVSNAGESFFADSFSPAVMAAAAIDCRADTASLENAKEVLFPAETSAQAGADIARLFTNWRTETPPRIPSLLMLAADHFGIDRESPAFQTALLAGIAAETPHPNPYHSPYHFREVVAAMMRLCHVHNATHDEKMTPNDIALCLATAAAHDLKHDGGTNLRDGVRIPAFLELRAIEALKPLAKVCGLSDRDIDDMATLIHVTDISGADSLRAGLRKIMSGQPEAVFPVEFARLAADKRLQNMAAMMSDADLTPSLATTHAFNRGTAQLLYKENPAIAVASFDKGLIFFIETVIGGTFVSDSGKTVGNQAMGAILHKARLNARKDPAPK